MYIIFLSSTIGYIFVFLNLLLLKLECGLNSAKFTFKISLNELLIKSEMDSF